MSAPTSTRGRNVVHDDESPRHCYFDFGGAFPRRYAVMNFAILREEVTQAL